MEELRNRIETPPPVVDPPAAGRPKGPSPHTADMLGELAQRILAAGDGADWTPIAVHMLRQRGFTVGLKAKADHLIRILRTQRFK
jgi:hypothetical protein